MPYINTGEFLDRLSKIQTIKWQLFDGCIRGMEVGTNHEHCPITGVVWSLTGKVFHPDMADNATRGIFNRSLAERIILAADNVSSDEEAGRLRIQLLRVLGLE